MKLEIAKKLAELFRRKESITSRKGDLKDVKKMEVRYLDESGKVIRNTSWASDSLEFRSIADGYDRELAAIDKEIEEM